MTYVTNMLKNLCTVEVPTPKIQPMLRISDVVAIVHNAMATRLRSGTAAAGVEASGVILLATRSTRLAKVGLFICERNTK